MSELDLNLPSGGRVLVSACLLGEAVRYDGQAKPCAHPILFRWIQEGRTLPFCPEVEGGLGVPRPRCEILGGDGEDVLDGRARVLDEFGEDRTAAFLRGAERALALCLEQGVSLALLKENSPSCGTVRIGDGTFTGTRRPGLGITAALLRRHGIRVLSEEGLG